jgi:hypothetical protein
VAITTNQERLLRQLHNLSQELRGAPNAEIKGTLSKRRRILQRFADQQTSPADSTDVQATLDAGHEVRTRLVIEMAQIRAEIQELEGIRKGLGRFMTPRKQSNLVDVRL